jgi:hypothetical protein
LRWHLARVSLIELLLESVPRRIDELWQHVRVETEPLSGGARRRLLLLSVTHGLTVPLLVAVRRLIAAEVRPGLASELTCIRRHLIVGATLPRHILLVASTRRREIVGARLLVLALAGAPVISHTAISFSVRWDRVCVICMTAVCLSVSLVLIIVGVSLPIRVSTVREPLLSSLLVL